MENNFFSTENYNFKSKHELQIRIVKNEIRPEEKKKKFNFSIYSQILVTQMT